MTNHRVDDEEHFIRVDGVANVLRLLHQLFVDAEATGGVNDDDAEHLLFGVFDRILGDLYRVTNTVTRLWSKNLNADAFTDYLKLIYRVWTLKVGSDQQWGVPLALEPVSKLSSERGLTRTLQTRQHDDGRWLLGEVELMLFATEDGYKLFVDDLNDLLGRVQGL